MTSTRECAELGCRDTGVKQCSDCELRVCGYHAMREGWIMGYRCKEHREERK